MRSVKKCQILLLVAVLLFCSGCGARYGERNDVSAPESNRDGTTAEFESYTLNPNATVLTMACWCLTEKEAILVDAFNRTHSDFQIEILSYFDGDPDNYETALLQMQTKLLTGDEPDLYSLNSMDVVSMEKAGLLMDLKPLMEADETFQREDYFMNVWDQYAVEGSLYEFVPTFVIRGLVGPKSLVGGKIGWTYAEMVTFIAEANKQHKQATDAISLTYAFFLAALKLLRDDNLLLLEVHPVPAQSQQFPLTESAKHTHRIGVAHGMALDDLQKLWNLLVRQRMDFFGSHSGQLRSVAGVGWDIAQHHRFAQGFMEYRCDVLDALG